MQVKCKLKVLTLVEFWLIKDCKLLLYVIIISTLKFQFAKIKVLLFHLNNINFLIIKLLVIETNVMNVLFCSLDGVKITTRNMIPTIIFSK